MFSRTWVGALTVLASIAAGSAMALDLEAAKKQFLTSCGVCQTAGAGEAHRQGPNLHGVYGRPAGSVADFKYSDALRAGGWTWTEETLDPRIENAQAAHPGTIMNYRQRDPEKRKLLIGYLKSLSGEAAPAGAG